MDYLELTIELIPRDPWTEIIIQQLADQGFESFVETDAGVQAYAPLSEINQSKPLAGTFLENAHPEVNAEFSLKIIPQQNWNAVWESSFDPVVVETYLSIVAPFHDKSLHKGMIIEIEPKMSFGTGHHQTTYLMTKALFELEGMPNRVLDMGTGTGVLAIVAEKLGARDVLAVDIEEWSVENTDENAMRNNCSAIRTICGDIDALVNESPFELILANINKNVLKAHLPYYSQLLRDGGILLLSGFFDTDVSELLSHAEENALEKMRIFNKDNWAAIQLVKK